MPRPVPLPRLVGCGAARRTGSYSGGCGSVWPPRLCRRSNWSRAPTDPGPPSLLARVASGGQPRCGPNADVAPQGVAEGRYPPKAILRRASGKPRPANDVARNGTSRRNPNVQQSASRNIPTSTARRTRSSSQWIRSSAKVRLWVAPELVDTLGRPHPSRIAADMSKDMPREDQREEPECADIVRSRTPSWGSTPCS